MRITGNAVRAAAGRESGFWMLGVVMSMSERGDRRGRDLAGDRGGEAGPGLGMPRGVGVDCRGGVR